MEERSNKTIMCSVLFLDIVEYSKKPVAGQISLKDRFNSYLSAAIRDVPVTDRIILDTGDGAAINFLGDVEDALKAAISLRESLLDEDPEVDHPLLVRMGVNLGPVRLVRDINGQPNIVGDGINVAQRVMGFADVAQILVSRSYYDAVSRLSPHYAGMFHYQGSRTDKHVREHEVYAIGYPGDKTTLRSRVELPSVSGQMESPLVDMVKRIEAVLHPAVLRLTNLLDELVIRFRKAQPIQRVLYAGIITAPFLLLIVLIANNGSKNTAPATPTGIPLPLDNTIVTVAPIESYTDTVTGNPEVISSAPPVGVPESAKADHRDKPVGDIQGKSVEKPKVKPMAKNADRLQKNKSQKLVTNKSEVEPATRGSKTGITVECTSGTEVFVDGVRKGKVDSRPLNIEIPTGPHAVIVIHTSGAIFSQDIKLDSGKMVHISPNFCK